MTEGEAWTRELLAELRTDRFRPKAWMRFLRRSFARAAVRRHERRREHRVVLVLAGSGAAAWLAAGLPVLGWRALAGAGWWLAVCLMLDWHLGMLERPDGRPLDRLGAANTLSLLRAGLVPALLLVSPAAAGVLLLAAGASDVADGWLARGRAEVTRLGVWLDGAVDTFVLGAAAIAAPLPGWVVALALARFTAPWAVVATAYFARAEAPGRDRAVSGRYPGLVLFSGLALGLFGLPGGAWLVAVGALGGLATFALSVARQHAIEDPGPGRRASSARTVDARMLWNPLTAGCEETGDALSDLVEGELEGWRRWRVVRHLARCEHCQAVHRSLLRTLAALRDIAGIEPAPRPALADAVIERVRRESSSP